MRKWNEVVGLVKSEADADTVAAAALDAAEKGLRKAADDEGLNQATWLLDRLLVFGERVKDRDARGRFLLSGPRPLSPRSPPDRALERAIGRLPRGATTLRNAHRRSRS